MRDFYDQSFKDIYGISVLIDYSLQLAFVLLAKFIVWIRPFIPTICFVATWTVIGMIIVSVVAMFKDGMENIRRMHRIPCAGCQYSSSDYRLKCSVHPSMAFSEEAIGCQDFESDSDSVGARSQSAY